MLPASCEIWERFYFCALPGNGAASAHQAAYLPTELAGVYIIVNSSHVSKIVSLVGSAMKNSTKRHAADKPLRCLLRCSAIQRRFIVPPKFSPIWLGKVQLSRVFKRSLRNSRLFFYHKHMNSTTFSLYRCKGCESSWEKS